MVVVTNLENVPGKCGQVESQGMILMAETPGNFSLSELALMAWEVECKLIADPSQLQIFRACIATGSYINKRLTGVL